MTYCIYCEKDTESYVEEVEEENFKVNKVYCKECNEFKYQYLGDLNEH